jgi:hypothetical protein
MHSTMSKTQRDLPSASWDQGHRGRTSLDSVDSPPQRTNTVSSFKTPLSLRQVMRDTVYKGELSGKQGPKRDPSFPSTLSLRAPF